MDNATEVMMKLFRSLTACMQIQVFEVNTWSIDRDSQYDLSPRNLPIFQSPTNHFQKSLKFTLSNSK